MTRPALTPQPAQSAAGIRMGSFRGVPIEIRWSVLLVGLFVAWITYSRLTEIFGVSQSDAVFAAIALVLGYGTSVLVHEMGHTAVAKHYDIEVERISLVFYGGAAELAEVPQHPIAAFWVALAGPIASGGCAVVATVAAMQTQGSALGLVLGQLAWANVLMVGLNMLPAHPLDGGHVLSAVLWHATRSRRRGREIVAWVGLTIGAIVLVYGLVRLLDGSRDTAGGIAPWFLVMVGAMLVGVNHGVRSEADDGGFSKKLSAARTSARAQQMGSAVLSLPPAQPAWAPVSWVRDELLRVNPTVRLVPLQDESGQLVGVFDAALLAAISPSQTSNPIAGFSWPLATLALRGVDADTSELEVAAGEAPSRIALVLYNGVPVRALMSVPLASISPS